MDTFSVVIYLGITGAFLGAFLAISARVFQVIKDPKIEAIEEALPGANCGACGQAGCAALAEAIAKGLAEIDSCPPGGAKAAQAIAEIMGQELVGDDKKIIAHIRCKGLSLSVAKAKFDYIGMDSCLMAEKVGNGWKACEYGCLMFGDCVRACKFDALNFDKEGKPVVDAEKCTACGLCVEACPRDLIVMLPLKKKTYMVSCMSEEKGGITKRKCSTGCIACSLCVKACKFDAIKVENFLATIDQEKCVGCGLCVKACPQDIIDFHQGPGKKKPAPKPKQDTPSPSVKSTESAA